MASHALDASGIAPATETRTPLRVFVFGSCVSRDVLAMAPANAPVALVGYHARSSLASLTGTPGSPDAAIDRIESPFQRRMVKADHEKHLLRALRTLQFDVLLIDLIDERFSLLRKPDGNLVTCSNEYVAVAGRPLPGIVIPSGSAEHVRLWRQGLERLLAELDAGGLRQRVRINCVFWAERDTEGRAIAGFNPEQTASANAFLRDRYSDLEAVLNSKAFLRYAPGQLVSDPTHRWGVSAFHYLPELYASTLDQLGVPARAAAPLGTDEDSGEQLPAAALASATAASADTVNGTSSLPSRAILEATPLGLKVSVLSAEDPALEFAYYLIRDQQRVDARWYSSRTGVNFPCPTIAGSYFVSVFQRHRPSGRIERYRTAALQMPLATQYSTARWSKRVQTYSRERRIVPVNGVHRMIGDGPASLDLFLQGFEPDQTAPAVIVCFSAAVSGREKKVAPFFSGMSIGKACGLPIVAVADPTLTRANNIGLGWYAGNDHFPSLAHKIATRLDELADAVRAPLLLIGGSGGGFATLAVMGQMKSNASAIVWNAQTSISKYYITHALRYVRCAFPELSRKARIDRQAAEATTAQQLANCLDEGRILHDLTAAAPAEHHPVLYLQNLSDHRHVDLHLAPLLSSRSATWSSPTCAADATGLIAWTGNWGDGHIPPPNAFLESIIREAAGGTALSTIAERLDAGTLQVQAGPLGPLATP